MSVRGIDDTVLVGPLVTHHDGGLWTCCIIRGRRGTEQAGADLLSATNANLLSAARSGLLAQMRAVTSLTDLHAYDDEMALARAAAERWPRKFASLVALGEVMQAGGGLA